MRWVRAPGLQKKLDELETRKTALQQLLAAPAPTIPRLHPNLAAVYRERVAKLRNALSGSDSRDLLEAVRLLIDRVEIRPGEAGDGVQIELVGQLAEMLRLADAERTKGPRVAAGPVLFASSVKVVARTGYRRSHHLLVPIWP